MFFRLIFSIVPFGFALLAMLLFVLPCRLRVRAQAIWAMVFLFCASKFVCFAQLGGDAFAPELPEKVIWFWNWAYSGMCLLLVVCVPGLLIRNRRVRLWLVPCAAWLLSLWGVYNGLKVPEVREETVWFPDLPASLDGYRVLQITDIHASAAARRWRTQAIVDRANAAGADAICLTGDYVDGMPVRQRRNIEPIKDLRARDGVFAVTGNHEFYFDFDRYMSLYRSWGITLLHGECVLPREGLAIGGVGDPAGLSVGLPVPTHEQVFASATNGEFRLLLQHRPVLDYAEMGIEARGTFDLQLAGHTHGGISPGLRWLIAKYNLGYVRGFYRTPEGGVLYVSTGAGQWAGFPIRYFDDPEIVLFVLRRGGGGAEPSDSKEGE